MHIKIPGLTQSLQKSSWPSTSSSSIQPRLQASAFLPLYAPSTSISGAKNPGEPQNSRNCLKPLVLLALLLLLSIVLCCCCCCCSSTAASSAAVSTRAHRPKSHSTILDTGLNGSLSANRMFSGCSDSSSVSIDSSGVSIGSACRNCISECGGGSNSHYSSSCSNSASSAQLHCSMVQ
jgi:hypothetical protein